MTHWLLALSALFALLCGVGSPEALASEPSYVGHGSITEKKIKPKKRLEVRDRAKRAAIADAVWRAVIAELGEATATSNEAALRNAVMPRAAALLDGDAEVVDETATSTTYTVTVEARVDESALRKVLDRVSIDPGTRGPGYRVAVVIDEYLQKGSAASRSLARPDTAVPPPAPATRGLDPIRRELLATEARIALVIGNAAYERGPLRNPVRDASAISTRLESLGFETTTVLDTDRRGLITAIREFGERLQEGGTGLFFYAGHGLQAAGENFLVPTDAQIDDESEIELESVRVERVLAAMRASGNRLNIVILDACRNNPYEARFRSTKGAGLTIMDPPQGTLIAFATNPGNVASDGTGDNGLYTQALLENMGRPGLSLEDTFKAVRARVSAESRGAQVPQEYTSLTGHFYFADAEGGVPQVPAPVLPRDQSTTFFNVVMQDPAALLRSGVDAPSGVAIEGRLKARRIGVVDPGSMKDLRQLLESDGTSETPLVTTLADTVRLGDAAAEFGQRYAADAIVVGATVIRSDGPVDDGARAMASLAARMVDAATGEVLASAARNATGLGADAEAAQRAAATRVGKIVGEDLAEGLRQHWRVRERDGWPLTIRVTGKVDARLGDTIIGVVEGVQGVVSAELRMANREAVEILVVGKASPRLLRPRILDALQSASRTSRLREDTYTRGVWLWEAP
ncbi:MAG: caspase family protein [Myxococcota bacterium]